MSGKKDRVNNESVIPFCHDQGILSGAIYNSPAYDSMLNRSYLSNMLLIVMMKTWGVGGRIVVRVQDSMSQAGTFVTFKSFASADQISTNTIFVGQANGFRRWVRLRINCIGASVSLTAVGILARGKGREPVPQHPLVEILSDGSSESSSSSQSSSSSSESSSSSSSSFSKGGGGQQGP